MLRNGNLSILLEYPDGHYAPHRVSRDDAQSLRAAFESPHGPHAALAEELLREHPGAARVIVSWPNGTFEHPERLEHPDRCPHCGGELPR